MLRSLSALPGFLLCFAALSAARGQNQTALDFNRDIRPILSDNCFACHGFDAKKRKADLRLDVLAGATADLGGHQAVKPGQPGASELVARILSTDPEEMMPPPDSHKKLSQSQIETLRRWISEGAPYAQHWAFEPPARAALPPHPSFPGWGRSPVDRFLGSRLTAESLAPAPEADRATLIRRLTLDLTGLPPTPQEVAAFLADPAPDAYGKLVDRLLQSQRYGEHMARYWLDAARYGDTHGLHLDNERAMWPWRDWVVRAFNDNLPYDQFTGWQIAGDLLPGATQDQKIASGFNRCNVTTSEGGSINEEFLFRYAVDRTDTMISVWMGLTGGCAVCHDHKFDPLTQKEFYQLYAFFYSAADPAMDGNILLTPPVLRLVSPEQKAQIEGFDKEIAALRTSLQQAVAKASYVDPATLTPPPAPREEDTVWLDDAFPAGAKVESSGGGPTTFVEAAKGPVLSGGRALQRTANGVGQDFYASGAADLTVPAGATFFVNAYLDPANPPGAIMIQFHTDGWKHRAVWGQEALIAFGKANTPEKVVMGGLPKAGEWVRLEVPAEKMGLKAGMKIKGFACTQHGGTVTWDRLGVRSRIDPVNDPRWSYAAWDKAFTAKPLKDFPQEITQILRGVALKDRSPAQLKTLKEYYLENHCDALADALDPIRSKLVPVEQKKKAAEDAVPATFIMADLPQMREANVMSRGQYDKPAEKVNRGTPAFLPALPAKQAYDRRDLAAWLTAPEHPLMARVTVNRLWQQFFGVGLVKTANDFGAQGEPPSHPELLDWLAVEFRESGWDVKGFIRTLVTSAAYRQSSLVTPEQLARDPENRLHARGARFRLDGEVIRDQALYVAGLLNPQIGGRGVNPYQPENIWEPVAYSGSNTRFFKQSTGPDLYRRSLYTFWKRTAPPPAMTTFDAPSREASCLRRERSNTPLQALVTMNDIQHIEAARAFAARILQEGGATEQARLDWAFRNVVARSPSPEESRIVAAALHQHGTRYAADPDVAAKLIAVGESKPPADIPPPELAAWTLVANLLLNMDETLTHE